MLSTATVHLVFLDITVNFFPFRGIEAPEGAGALTPHFMQMKDSGNAIVSITNGIFIKQGKYEKLIQDMMLRFKASTYPQAELFRDCAFETATGIFDHVATGNQEKAIDWAGLVLHHPSEEIWKVGPVAVMLKTWWTEFAGKMSLEEFCKCPPIVIEVLQSINEFKKQEHLNDNAELKRQLDALERSMNGKK